MFSRAWREDFLNLRPNRFNLLLLDFVDVDDAVDVGLVCSKGEELPERLKAKIDGVVLPVDDKGVTFSDISFGFAAS